MDKSKKILSIYKKIPPILLIVATLFMSMAYAEISDINLGVEGVVVASQQEGVYISDVTYMSSSNADVQNSKINYYLATTLDSEIVLGNVSTSTITYQITLYNNSNEDHVYIDTLTDKVTPGLYSNTDIEFSTTGLEKNTTTIKANDYLKFTITFKYTDIATLEENTLISKLNFRFKEIPKLLLSNESTTYTLTNIYPDYMPQEYEFTISNYDDISTNKVPMTYQFETTIDSPLTAKIYNENGEEVTDGLKLSGDGQEEVFDTYTLKIIWDDSVSSDYNIIDYADKQFDCKVILKAIPYDEEYLEYTITKEFNVDITTAPFYFNYPTGTQNINIEKNNSILELTIANNNSTTEYNTFDTTYEMLVTGNSKFTVTHNSTNILDNPISLVLGGGAVTTDKLTINFAADINNLNVTETATLNISVKAPYIKEISIPLQLAMQPLTVKFNANGGSVSTQQSTVYKGKTYENLPTPTWFGHTFDGWYTALEGGTQITNSTEVTSANMTQTLYAHWTSHLLVDHVETGDYVNFDIEYSNVNVIQDSVTYRSNLTGWRVVDVIGEGDDRYVTLVTAGIPLTYRHPWTATASTSVTNLTTGFFNTPISSTATNYYFNLCGFTGVSTISGLKTLFKNNQYTQLDSSGNPMVQALTADDIKNATGITVGNLTDFRGNYLWAVPSATTSGNYAYVAYYLGTNYDSTYLYVSYFEGYVVYSGSSNPRGVRPVVSLKTTVGTTGKIDDVHQITILTE